MKDVKEKIIAFLMDEYEELDATKQVCFAEIEKIKVIKVTYENGITEYLEEKEDCVIKIKL